MEAREPKENPQEDEDNMHRKATQKVTQAQHNTLELWGGNATTPVEPHIHVQQQWNSYFSMS